MGSRVKSFLFQQWPVWLMVILSVVLVWKNVVPGTWLVGWDNTLPELNFSLNLERILNSVWQEYRGLGMVDGMAHAANIGHWIYLRLLAFLLPLNYVRYAFMLLMHVIGGVGLYWLVRYVFGKDKRSVAAGLIGGLFYMLNPITIQMFFAPLELFIIHYAFLPWTIGTLIGYLESGSKKQLTAFVLTSMMIVSQAHVPTVFIVYSLIVGLFLLVYRKKFWQVILVTLAVNAFWLLPYMYSVVKIAPMIAQAKMNRLSNYETQLRNDAYGDMKSLALMRGFSLSYEDWVGGDQYGWQMQEWRSWWTQPQIEMLMWTLWGLSLLGLVLIVARKDKRWYPVLAIWFVGWLTLGSRVPVVGSVIQFMRDYVPYFGQLFRFAFTKFGFMYVFAYTLLAAYPVFILTKWHKVTGLIISIVGSGMVLAVAWPVFSGSLFYHQLRLPIPDRYFSLFELFEKPEYEGRIALLPTPSFWGWEFNSWGHRGSGFIWQGVRQPLLTRSFDPWNVYNETFYNELSHAIYGNDWQLFDQVLDKYAVEWLLLDESVFIPGGWQDRERIGLIEAHLNKHDIWKEIWTEGNPGQRLIVYGRHQNNSSPWLEAPELFGYADINLDYGVEDKLYHQDRAYIDRNGETDTVYPFAPLTAENLPGLRKNGDDTLIWEKRLSVRVNKYQYFSDESIQPAKAQVTIRNWGVIQASWQAEPQNFAFFDARQPENCGAMKRGNVGRQIKENKLELWAFNEASSCDYLSLTLPYDRSYLVRLSGENRSGRGLRVTLINNTSKQAERDYLFSDKLFDVFAVISAKSKLSDNGDGYTLNFEARSFGFDVGNAVVYPVEVYELPENWLASIRMVSNVGTLGWMENAVETIDVERKLPWLYQLKVEKLTNHEGLIIFNQGYEKGWLGFQGRKKLEHVKANGWANGWIIPDDATNRSVTIFYWPQLLEWLGFGLSGILLFGVGFVSLKRRV